VGILNGEEKDIGEPVGMIYLFLNEDDKALILVLLHLSVIVFIVVNFLLACFRSRCIFNVLFLDADKQAHFHVRICQR
jgi:hypothetical protein